MVDIKRFKIAAERHRKPPRRRSLLIGRKSKVVSTVTAPKAIRAEPNQMLGRWEEPSEDLTRVERGEMTEQEYLERRVEEALSHAKGRVSGERLGMIRDTLLMKLETDPVLRRAKARVFQRKSNGKG